MQSMIQSAKAGLFGPFALIATNMGRQKNCMNSTEMVLAPDLPFGESLQVLMICSASVLLLVSIALYKSS